jgi:P-type E1-E2 ATPase
MGGAWQFGYNLPGGSTMGAKGQGIPGIRVEIPGRKGYRITHVVFDFNGTLAADGRLIPGVAPRIRRLARTVEVVVMTSDTYGTARRALAGLPLTLGIVCGGRDKRRLVESLGAAETAVVGNGANDLPMFRAAALGIAVLGPEGLAAELLPAATIAVREINDALDLLLRPQRLMATLRR